jgi:chromosome segregation ATPase
MRRLRAVSARFRHRSATFTLILTIVCAVSWAGTGLAQAPDVLTSLLTEVRGLRAAMEQMASTGPRVQLALGRLQLQEQRIGTLLRRLDQVKDTLASAQQDAVRMEDRVKQLGDPPVDVTPQMQRDMESELKHLKSELTWRQATVQRLLNEESTLNQEISSEQGRWSELNQRLEDLERSLGRR